MIKGGICVNFELFPGVRVNFIKNTQFKSVQLMVSFIKELNGKKELAQRTLLASMLESTSQKYRNQHEITIELAKLYGATFGTNTEVEGNVSLLNFVYSFINPRFLPGKSNLLHDSILFLNEMIFHQNIQNNMFSQKIFNRQKENLMTYIKGINDNKQSEAILKIQELYFKDEIQKYVPYGSQKEFEAINNQDLTASYFEMLTQDYVQITVMGDLELDDLKAELKNFEFKAHSQMPSIANQISYHQAVYPNVKKQTMIQNVRQSKLDLIYQLPIDSQAGQLFFDAVVFNAMLGGSPQSKLFRNVREKESLAYYADSSYSAFRTIILIQTGIQAENKDKVVDLIQQQVSDLKKGNFTDDELTKIKMELINGRKRMLDNPSSIIEQQVLSILVEQDLSYEYQCEAIQQVTREAVQNVASKMKLQAEFFLKGEDI